MSQHAIQPVDVTAGRATAPWPWLEDVLTPLEQMGLMATAYDMRGNRVYASASPGPFFQSLMDQRLLPCRRESSPTACPMTCDGTGGTCVPGVECVQSPILRRRRQVGTVAVCLVCRDMPDSEEFARVCQAGRLDRELMVRLSRQQARFDRAQLDSLRQMLNSMLEQAIQKHTSEQELAELSANLTSTYEELSLVYKISAAMRVTDKPGDQLRTIGNELLEVMDVESLGIRYFRPDQPLVSEHINVGAELTAPSVEQTMWDELLSHFENGPSEMVDNRVAHIAPGSPLRSLANHRRVRQLAAVPMMRDGKLLGALVAMNKRSSEFNSGDVKLMKSIADEGCVFLENSFLYEDLQQLVIGMLRALTSAIDAKDPYTCGHSERVAVIASRIAEAAGLDEQSVGRVHLAGLLHDIGKIGVPEAVLTKPGRLTKPEFAVMRKHPEIGARILAGIKQVQDLIPGVLHHHERMDGRGYPGGLAGEGIPLFGRIVGLADCFDAMTSNRTYRRALPLEVTLTEIRRYAGTQFDPQIVEAFFKLDAAKLIQQTRQTDPLDPLDNVVRQTSSLMSYESVSPGELAL